MIILLGYVHVYVCRQWSFGVVMWEVMTRGKTPYQEMDNPAVIEYVKQGGRLLKPQYCPDEVYVYSGVTS